MHTKPQSGFTLVELAVVVLLIGMIASIGVVSLKAQLASAAISATQKKQDTIKDALIAYLAQNKRLPCPATINTGLESRATANTPASCTGNFGYLPYATLNLPKSAALDGWDNFFSYAVSPQWTLSSSTASPIAGGTFSNVFSQAFSVSISGAITVSNRIPSTSATTTPITSNAVIVLVSHGKNGLGAYTSKGTNNIAPVSTTDEYANAPVSTWSLPPTFFQRDYTDVDVPTYGAFDDGVQWFSAADLVAPLAKDGTLQSASSLWTTQITNINNAITSYVLTNAGSNCAPPLSNQFASAILSPNNIPGTDPWGNTIEYVQCVKQITQSGGFQTAQNIPNTPFYNPAAGANQTYVTYCQNPGQLAYAITTLTNSTTNPVTKLPAPTPTVATLFGANSSYMSNQSNHCP
jgi:prepilin-type N-terminal cleavage/methylation domain-containing protein